MIRTKAVSTAFSLFLLGGSIAVLQAQGTRNPPPSKNVISNTKMNASIDAPSFQPQLKQRNARYTIQPQDVLLLSFPLSPELNQTVTVQPDGYINLQDAEGLKVQGLTVPELAVALKTAYTGVLHDPIINVDLQNFQKPFFTVDGQVGKPGQYELRARTNVAEALAIAGGMTPTAKTQVFLFRRTSKDWVEVRKVNLKEILSGKHVNEDSEIQSGDMIYVPEKFIANFRKYVPYSLNAGTYLQPAPF